MSQKKQKRIRSLDQEKLTDIRAKEESNYIPLFKIIKDNWFFLALLMIGIVFLFLNSLRGDFVSDDYASITQNTLVTNSAHMLSGLNPVTVSIYVIAKIFGTSSPIPYHVFNLLVYMVFCFAAFIFITLVFNNKLAMMTLALFAVHPIHVEAVSWISGKPYLIFPAMAMLFFIFFIEYTRSWKKFYLYWSLILFFLAFWSDKVRFFSLVLLVILYLSIYGREILKKIQIQKIVIAAAITLTVVVIAIWPMIMERVNSVNSGYNASDSIFYNPFFQYPTSIAKYLQLLAFPFDLTLYHTMYIFPVPLNWAIFLLYIGMTVYFWFKRKDLCFALAFIFLATAPSMAPIKVSWLVAERYVFFGSLGFCLFLGILLKDLFSKTRILSMGLLAVLCSLGMARTYLRNIDWQTNHKLWVNTCQVSPNSHNAWNNIGDDYDKLKQMENAVKGFTQSTVVKQNYADAYHNRANIFFKMGRLDLAKDSYLTALQYSPNLYQSYFSLTQIALMERNFNDALKYAGSAVQIVPNNPQAWYVVGVVYLQGGSIENAKKALNNALTYAPGYGPAFDLLNKINSDQQVRQTGN